MNEESLRSAATSPLRRSTGSMPMSGLTLHPPPLLNPSSPSRCCCSSGSSPFSHPPLPVEDDLRRLLDRVPSYLLSSPESDLSHELVRRFLVYDDEGGDAPPRLLCPGLKRCVHALVDKLLKERTAAGSIAATMKLGPATSSSPSSGSRKRKRDVRGLLEWLRGAAKDPVELLDEARQWKKPILEARKVMFEKLDKEVRAREFHSSSKRRGKKFKEEAHQKVLDQPTRRSERIANNAYLKIRHLCNLKKRIGYGPTFQADIPDCTGPITDKTVDVDAVKWLGTQIRPADVVESLTSESVVGKGRPSDCTCSSPGSKSCVSFHVHAASLQLRSDLGQFFTYWGFDTMGEGILESWEQKNFAALENESSGKSFWKMISNQLNSLSKRDLVKYYFNVFLLRRIGNLSRQVPEVVNTDEEENSDEEEVENDHLKQNVKAQVASSSPRSGNTQKEN